MELAPSGVPLSFEVTFDRADLDVGMTVFDDSENSPILIAGPFAMNLVAGYTYRGKFTATANKTYIIIKSVYTDETLETLDPNYSQGSESIAAEELSGGGGTSECGILLGFVQGNNALIGLVENDSTVTGFVNC